jgi:predicted nucleotidyltransferase
VARGRQANVRLIDLEHALRVLAQGGVELIVVGGVAARAHGSTHLTNDLDVLYHRTQANMDRLAAALSPHSPYLRGAPPGLPFRWDAETIRRGLNFTLTTSLGDLDLLGEITGGGSYKDLLSVSSVVDAFGVRVRCLNLEPLIIVKRAAGRPKDLQVVAELEALKEERDRPPSS